jgi:type 1 glutamine amidotransferase
MLKNFFSRRLLLGLTTLSLTTLSALSAEEVKPLKVLLVIGGCCHDYATQKLILAEGISARANVDIHIEHNPDTSKETSTKATFDIYKKTDWATGYDVIIHDECTADVTDKSYVQNILNAHKAGTPAVNLHCAMHSYRWGNFKERLMQGAENAAWYEFTAMQTCQHGPKEPIAITFTDTNHPITKGLENWTTINEELYHSLQIFPTAHALAKGDQVVTDKDTQQQKTESDVVAWINEYGANKTRVFNTTLGHMNETVADARYLDLISRGLLWAAGKLDENGKPLPGYESKQKPAAAN